MDKINHVNDLRKIATTDLPILCKELRKKIIDTMSSNPGHLGASLGAVEIAVGIHYIFDTPNDNLIWDVGHQAYAHKILTGRKESFSDIRNLHGISGFPKMNESEFDSFGTGHSSTSISAATGMAIANQLQGKYNQNIAVIGDGSLTGGMAFEALNHLVTTNANVLVIINDNDMSIDDSVGGLQNHLNNIDTANNIFTQLGFKYFGTTDGNDISQVIAALTIQKTLTCPRILHLKTQKGFGYTHAEIGNATHWHAPGKFEIETGTSSATKNQLPVTYQKVVGDSLCKIATTNQDVVVITPAMGSGSGLIDFKNNFPSRFFDVGIAEQHAVTFAAGLATQGKLPFCVIYATFLQRGYDQVIHDIALQNLKVVLLVDRAGIVGHDGATHHGMFDLAFLNCIPNLTIYTPLDEQELQNLLFQIPKIISGPVVIRYPRGLGVQQKELVTDSHPIVGIRKLKTKGNTAIISIGNIGNTVKKIVLEIEKTEPIAHYSLLVAKPLDTTSLAKIFQNHTSIIIVEDGVLIGGIGSNILQWCNAQGYQNKIKIIGYPDQFIEQGAPNELYKSIQMDYTGLLQQISEEL